MAMRNIKLEGRRLALALISLFENRVDDIRAGAEVRQNIRCMSWRAIYVK